MNSKANISLPSLMMYSLECTSNNGKIAESWILKLLIWQGNPDYLHLLQDTSKSISQDIYI